MNRKIKALIIIATLILIIGAIAIYQSFKDVGQVTYEADTNQQIASSKTDTDLEAIYNEADFKKMMELRARKIKAEREMETENKRHDETIATLEAELEDIRSQELESFQ